MLGEAKAAGILLERSGDRVIAGFGVNLAAAPLVEGRRTAHLGGTIRPEAFAPLLAGAFDRLLTLWRSTPPHDFAQAWLARAHPVGTMLRIHGAPGDVVEGEFRGIEPDGALLLRTAAGDVLRMRSGDVEL